MFFKPGISLFLVAVFIFLTGCATIVSKNIYPVSINSTPSGAKVTIFDHKGVDVFAGETPAIVSLNAGAGFFKKADYSAVVEIEGYTSQTGQIRFDLDGWYFGNILIGGLLGMLIIDPATGAMWKLETEHLNLVMQKLSADSNDPALRIIDYADVPDDLRQYLVKIEN